ncbi:DMT family transporter [Aestuariivirga sp.]|uniref:DMT family transporter n=1 Tax=Aestuariivirga sp. TaxID=2650926 RepID=UPI0039E37D92
MAQPSHLRGIGAMLLAAGVFVGNDTCMKLAMEDAPPFQVLAMRGLAACIWCLPLVLFTGQGRALPLAASPWVVLRSLFELSAILMFILALNQMAIADVTAILQISPFLVLLGGWMIWGERISGGRLLLIAIGIIGALMVAQPGSSTASPFAILGFAAAVGAAARDIASRKVGANVPALVVTFAVLVIVMVAAFFCMLLFETAVMPTRRALALMALAGFLLMCGHAFVFLAFRLAPARAVAPFNYSSTLWAVVSGIVAFGHFPDGLALIGMALIILTGLGVILLEGRIRQGALPSLDPDASVISK